MKRSRSGRAAASWSITTFRSTASTSSGSVCGAKRSATSWASGSGIGSMSAWTARGWRCSRWAARARAGQPPRAMRAAWTGTRNGNTTGITPTTGWKCASPRGRGCVRSACRSWARSPTPRRYCNRYRRTPRSTGATASRCRTAMRPWTRSRSMGPTTSRVRGARPAAAGSSSANRRAALTRNAAPGRFSPRSPGARIAARSRRETSTRCSASTGPGGARATSMRASSTGSNASSSTRASCSASNAIHPARRPAASTR